MLTSLSKRSTQSVTTLSQCPPHMSREKRIDENDISGIPQRILRLWGPPSGDSAMYIHVSIHIAYFTSCIDVDTCNVSSRSSAVIQWRPRTVCVHVRVVHANSMTSFSYCVRNYIYTCNVMQETMVAAIELTCETSSSTPSGSWTQCICSCV